MVNLTLMEIQTTVPPFIALLADEGDGDDLAVNVTFLDPGVSRSEDNGMATFHLAVAVCCLLLGVLGLLGNALALLVWSDARMQRSSPSLSVLLLGLAAFDLVFLVCLCLSSYLYPALYYSGHTTTLLGENVLWVVQALTYPPMHISRLASVYVTVAVTLERALAVTRPLMAVTFGTKVNSRLCLLLVGVVSLVYNLPRFWERQLVTGVDPSTNQTYLHLSGTPFTSSSFFRIYNLYIQFVVVFVVPFIIILVCNSAILWTLHREAGKVKSRDGVVPLRSFRGRNNARWEGSEVKLVRDEVRKTVVKPEGGRGRRSGGREGGAGNSRLTATVMALTLCFFVTHLVPAVSLILKYMDISGLSRLDQGSPEIQYLQGVGYILVTFNSASNFLFFSLLGRKFRNVLMSRSSCCCCCWCCRDGWKPVSMGTNRRSYSTHITALNPRPSTKPSSHCNSTRISRTGSLSSSSSSSSSSSTKKERRAMAE